MGADYGYLTPRIVNRESDDLLYKVSTNMNLLGVRDLPKSVGRDKMGNTSSWLRFEEACLRLLSASLFSSATPRLSNARVKKSAFLVPVDPW